MLIAIAGLAACSSVGVQYRPPTETQPSATFTGTDGAFITNFNDEGCYVGRTHVPESAQLRAGEPVFITYEAKYPNLDRPNQELFCGVTHSFVPQAQQRYRLDVDLSRKVVSKNLLGNVVEMPACSVRLLQEQQDGTRTEVQTTRVAIRTKRFACMKAVPLNPAK